MSSNNKNAVCPDCQQVMAPGNGCTLLHIKLQGKEYERIKAGASDSFESGVDDGYICHDCNAAKRQYHHFGCDMERCPACHDQLFCCDCTGGDEEVELGRAILRKSKKLISDELR